MVALSILTTGKNCSTMRPQKKNILSLLGFIFLDQTYLTITFPLVTLIFFDQQSRLFPPETDYAVRSLWYGACVALPNIINMFFSPALSILSDEVGRKKILLLEIFSAFIFTTTVGIGVYTGKLLFIFAGFTVKGAFSRTNPTALAIIGDSVQKSEKILYMGYLQFAISLGASLGPFVGGYFAMRYFFNELNFALPFFIAATLASLNTLLVFLFIKETLPAKKKSRQYFQWQALKAVFLRKETLHISMLLLLIQFSWSMYYQFAPPIFKNIYHFDAHKLGIFISTIAIWLTLTTGIIIRVLQKYFSAHQMLLFAVSSMLIGYSITIIACSQSNESLAWLGAFPVAAGDVIAYSCLIALYSNVARQDQQGKVMGMSFIVYGATWTTTGFLGGILMSIYTILPLFIAPIGILIALYLLRAASVKALTLSYATAN